VTVSTNLPRHRKVKNLASIDNCLDLMIVADTKRECSGGNYSWSSESLADPKTSRAISHRHQQVLTNTRHILAGLARLAPNESERISRPVPGVLCQVLGAWVSCPCSPTKVPRLEASPLSRVPANRNLPHKGVCQDFWAMWLRPILIREPHQSCR
jgi:hypothetical protein